MTSQPAAFVLRSRRVVSTGGVLPGDIWIRNGVIAGVVPLGQQPINDIPMEDVGNRVVMPGLVDTHVHINEPGRTEWEGFTTATQAAASGGITTLVDMPLNCIPVTTTLEALEIKRREAATQLWTDCGFYWGVIPGNANQLEPMIAAGVLGFKCFLIHSGIDDFSHVGESDLRKAMAILARHNVPLLVHAELDCNEHQEYGDSRQYQSYLNSRPPRWETEAIALMIRLCRETGCWVHIVHLSCADALPMIREARAEGLPLTVETCPHYLTLYAESVPDGDTRFKCAPPIRELENAQRLWQGLLDDTIDFIVSDHSPCTPELKLLEQGDFAGAWGGISSLQFGLSLVWTEALRRGVGLEQLVRWMCQRPAWFIRLEGQKGAIAPGYDADLVVWEPEASFTVTPDKIYHRHKVTPYEGKQLYGVVHKTLLRGKTAYENSRLSPTPFGKILTQAVSSVEGVPV
jgi:allantoinase